MKTKYTVEFTLEDETLEDGLDIVEPSVERGLIKADEKGVATWWYQSSDYKISWNILKKEKTK